MIKVKNTDGTWSPVTGSGASIIEKTYAELKTLKDTSKLTVGQLYRITDYVATTTQANTQSANHPFDIIVQATSATSLNENAMACLHTGDTYFSSCDLNAWEIKYCLDINTAYTWANMSPTLATIVVEETTYTRDSSKDEVFKDDLSSGSDLYAKGFTAEDGTYLYTLGLDFEVTDAGSVTYEIVTEEYISLTGYSEATDTFSSDGGTWHYTGEICTCGGRTYYRLEGIDGEYTLRASTATSKANAISTVKAGSTVATVRLSPIFTDTKEIQGKTLKDNEEYRGVIYYMKDEYNNEAGYDFKGIMYDDYYTFSYQESASSLVDGSLTGNCKGNVIEFNSSLPVIYTTKGSMVNCHFGKGCQNIVCPVISYFTFQGDNKYITLSCTTSEYSNNYIILNSTSGTSASTLTIDVNTNDTGYPTYVGYNSDGTLTYKNILD